MKAHRQEFAQGSRIGRYTVDRKLGGGSEELDIEAGTQPGAVLRVRGQGLPSLERRGRGDLLVTVRVRIPRRLDAEQRALYEKLAELGGDETSERGLFDRVKDIFGS